MTQPRPTVPPGFALTAATSLLLVCGLGIVLRAGYVFGPVLPGLDFRNIVHAHSHVAFFGWASLALMGLVYHALAESGAPVSSRWTGWHLGLTIAATAGAGLAFLWAGYWPVSIAFSAVNTLLWYLFAGLFASTWIRLPRSPWPSKHPSPSPTHPFFAAAVAYLVLSSLSTWLLTVFTATHASSRVLEAGVAFYLHNFTEGWFGLGIAGACYWLVPRLTGRPLHNPRLARWHLWLAIVFTAPGFLTELPQAPDPWPLVGRLALAGSLVGTGLFLYNMARTIHGRGGRWPLPVVASGLVFLAIKSGLDLTRFVPGLAQAAQASQARVGYLHLLLFGFVSVGLMGLLEAAVSGGRARRRGDGWFLWLVDGGVAGMAGCLLLLGLVALRGQPLLWVGEVAWYWAGALAFSLALGLAALWWTGRVMSRVAPASPRH